MGVVAVVFSPSWMGENGSRASVGELKRIEGQGSGHGYWGWLVACFFCGWRMALTACAHGVEENDQRE